MKITDFSGLVLLNKPQNISSAAFLNRAKKAIGIKKAGHCGTLDPMAEGLLICCVNKGTRLATFLLPGNKTYAATMKLGETTDTQDAEGEVTQSLPVPALSAKEIAQAMQSFVGKIDQVPPVYSALKHEGQPLYKLARQGRAVTKPARKITVYNMQLLSVDLPYISLSIKCSSGTYVRTLCHDLGQKLGCGAHMVALKRTETCGLNLVDALTEDDLAGIDKDAALPAKGFISMADALPFMPKLTANSAVIEKLCYGRPLFAHDFAEAINGQQFAVVDAHHNLLAIIEFTNQDMPFKQLANFSGV